MNKYFKAYLTTLSPDEAEQAESRYKNEPAFTELIDSISPNPSDVELLLYCFKIVMSEKHSLEVS